MKNSVVRMLSGAMALAAIMLVSCAKELPGLKLDIENPSAEEGANLVISQGSTLEIPFTVGAREGYTVTATATSDNELYQANAVIDESGAAGTISIEAPEFIFEDATIKVDLTITDAANSRTVTKSFEISAKSILENLAVSSNCHLVSPGSFIKFAAVKGNTTEKVSAEKVELLWQDAAGLVDSTFTLTKEEIYVSLAKELQGNAVVAAKNAEGTILWSWHIWVSAEDPTANLMSYTYTPAEGESQSFQFMDRNLGALSAELGTAAVNGCFYQWGRKDPFPGPTYERTYKTAYNSKGEVIEFSKATPEVVNNIDNAIKTPLTYYLHESTNSGNYSWITNSALSVAPADVNDLWGGVTKKKTMYDPCPAGYRVPQLAAWQFLSDNGIVKEQVVREGAPETPAHTDKMGIKVNANDLSFYFPHQGHTTNITATSKLTESYGADNGNPLGSLWSSQFDGNFNGTSASVFRAYTCNIRSYSLSYYATFNLHYAHAVRCIKE